jgi:hypothetical protein
VSYQWTGAALTLVSSSEGIANTPLAPKPLHGAVGAKNTYKKKKEKNRQQMECLISQKHKNLALRAEYVP